MKDLPSPVDLAWVNKEEENCLGNTGRSTVTNAIALEVVPRNYQEKVTSKGIINAIFLNNFLTVYWYIGDKRGHGFKSCSRKITCHRVTKPMCHKYRPRAASTEPWALEPHVLQQEKQLQGETRAPQLESSPHLPTRESPHRSVKEPTTAKKRKKIF